MSKDNTRFVLTLPQDLAEQTQILKKEIFYDKPYAEMYRQLIQLGLQNLHNGEDEAGTPKNRKP